MTRRDMLWRWIAALLFAQACGACVAAPRGELCLDSTFIQLWQEHLSWPDTRWKSLFDALDRLGVQEVVVQWSEVDGVRFFGIPAPATDPIDIILRQARRHGMRVILGMSHDVAYWTRVARPDRAAYLDERRARNELLIDALARKLARTRTIAGWYISDEIDDLTWTGPRDGAALNGYLRGLASRLGAQGRSRWVAVSGFANAGTEPDALAQQWNGRLGTVRGLKRLYFQDGVGVGKLQVDDLAAYYAMLAKTARRNGATLVPVVEAFVQVAGAPLDDGAYAARPPPLERFEQQVRVARKTGKVGSFGVPEYLSPEGGEAAAQAYTEWLARLDSRHERCGVTDRSVAAPGANAARRR